MVTARYFRVAGSVRRLPTSGPTAIAHAPTDTDVAGAFRFEWQKFGVIWADVPIGRLGHLVPDTRDLTEGFGDDQPRVV